MFKMMMAESNIRLLALLYLFITWLNMYDAVLIYETTDVSAIGSDSCR